MEDTFRGYAVVLAYTRPRRFILKNANDQWEVTIDDINLNTYDYARLHRLSTSFDIKGEDLWCIHLCFDGSIVLPSLPEFYSLDFVLKTCNQLLAEMLLGGVYFEAVEPNDVDKAALYHTGYVWPMGLANSQLATLLFQLKLKVASAYERIHLLNPATVTAQELHDARDRGQKIGQKIDNLSLLFIIRGVSAYRHHEWLHSLLNFWFGVEQVVSWYWENWVIKGKRQPSTPIAGRTNFLNDFRSWTTASQIEVLYQLAAIDEDTYRKLNEARKARNNLVHKGQLPEEKHAIVVFEGFFQLLSLAYTDGDSRDSFAALLEEYKTPKPFEVGFVEYDFEEGQRRREFEREGQAYRFSAPRPSIPGEPKWGEKEYEKVFVQEKTSWQRVSLE